MAADKFGWQQKLARLQRMKSDLPKKIANTAQLHFNQEFNKSQWDGKPWAPRKDTTNKRHLLVRTGRLRADLNNCIRTANWARITLALSTPYAEAQNYGVDKVVSVRAHTRRKMGTVRVASIKTHRSKKVNAQVGSLGIGSFKRHMRLPARKFIGDSPELRKKIHMRFAQACREVFIG